MDREREREEGDNCIARVDALIRKVGEEGLLCLGSAPFCRVPDNFSTRSGSTSVYILPLEYFFPSLPPFALLLLALLVRGVMWRGTFVWARLLFRSVPDEGGHLNVSKDSVLTKNVENGISKEKFFLLTNRLSSISFYIFPSIFAIQLTDKFLL